MIALQCLYNHRAIIQCFVRLYCPSARTNMVPSSNAFCSCTTALPCSYNHLKMNLIDTELTLNVHFYSKDACKMMHFLLSLWKCTTNRAFYAFVTTLFEMHAQNALCIFLALHTADMHTVMPSFPLSSLCTCMQSHNFCIVLSPLFE